MKQSLAKTLFPKKHGVPRPESSSNFQNISNMGIILKIIVCRILQRIGFQFWIDTSAKSPNTDTALPQYGQYGYLLRENFSGECGHEFVFSSECQKFLLYFYFR